MTSRTFILDSGPHGSPIMLFARFALPESASPALPGTALYSEFPGHDMHVSIHADTNLRRGRSIT